MFGLGKKKKQPQEESRLPSPPEEDLLPEDSLSDIIRDLPVPKPESDEASENAGETPESQRESDDLLRHAMAMLDRLPRHREAAADEEEFEDGESRPNPGRKIRTGRGKRKAAPAGGDTLQDSPDGLSSMSRSHPVLRRFLLSAITILLLTFMVSIIMTQILAPNNQYYGLVNAPGEAVTAAMTPVQSFFSSLADAATSYFRTLKRRANIEEEYNAVVARNEQLEYQAMLANELQIRLGQYEDMSAEIRANQRMQPLVCSVIGRDEGNYFSTFTINQGSASGIEPFMAVTYGSALIGYTETVSENQATVRAIIDSDASIAGLIQSSRDQGTVRGTLGIDGTAMCRMYYLPEEHLPRPGDIVVTSGVGMSFPKGIPIGTVRESTRGLEANKQYIVVEPYADFQHIEYVIVLRYKPEAEAVQGRESVQSTFVPLEPARPVPTQRDGSNVFWPTSQSTSTPVPPDIELDENGEPVDATLPPTMSPSPRPTLAPTAEPTRTTNVRNSTSIEYVTVHQDTYETPVPTPTPRPSPTPFITLHPSNMEMEEEE